MSHRRLTSECLLEIREMIVNDEWLWSWKEVVLPILSRIVPSFSFTSWDKLHSTNFTAQTTQHKLHSTNCTAQTAQHKLHSTNYTAQTTRYKLHRTNYTAQTTRRKLHDANYTAQTTQHKLHSANYTAQTTQHKLHGTNYTAQTRYSIDKNLYRFFSINRSKVGLQLFFRRVPTSVPTWRLTILKKNFHDFSQSVQTNLRIVDSKLK